MHALPTGAGTSHGGGDRRSGASAGKIVAVLRERSCRRGSHKPPLPSWTPRPPTRWPTREGSPDHLEGAIGHDVQWPPPGRRRPPSPRLPLLLLLRRRRRRCFRAARRPTARESAAAAPAVAIRAAAAATVGGHGRPPARQHGPRGGKAPPPSAPAGGRRRRVQQRASAARRPAQVAGAAGARAPAPAAREPGGSPPRHGRKPVVINPIQLPRSASQIFPCLPTSNANTEGTGCQAMRPHCLL